MSNSIQLTFLKAGLLSLVVDNSKIGFQKYGVPVGGPMDSASASIANKLVGNKIDTPLLEINLVGPEIQLETDCEIAITGADLSPTIDSSIVEMNEILSVKAGKVLKFGKPINGSRAYLTIRGNWKVSDWLKDDSPRNISTLRGLNSIEIMEISNQSQSRKINIHRIFEHSLTLHVMKGPEFDTLTSEVSKKLLNTTFKLLAASNRMGYRLSPNLPAIGNSIISSGVVPGTLQITQEGFPILLMQDGPATGGYVRALNVMSEDMSKLGQLKAGDNLKFKLI